MSGSAGADSSFQIEAPGTVSTLLHLMGAEVLPILSADYAAAKAAGGNVELAHREPGASFNPRMARVAVLVVHEGGQSSLLAGRSAIWSCVLPESSSAVPAEVVEIVDKVARGDITHPIAATVCAALELDTLRHLHMAPISRDDQYLKYLEIASRWTSSAEAAIAERLKVKLHHAIAMQKRRFQLLEDD